MIAGTQGCLRPQAVDEIVVAVIVPQRGPAREETNGRSNNDWHAGRVVVRPERDR